MIKDAYIGGANRRFGLFANGFCHIGKFRRRMLMFADIFPAAVNRRPV
jgi:hypothetical protein